MDDELLHLAQRNFPGTIVFNWRTNTDEFMIRTTYGNEYLVESDGSFALRTEGQGTNAAEERSRVFHHNEHTFSERVAARRFTTHVGNIFETYENGMTALIERSQRIDISRYEVDNEIEYYMRRNPIRRPVAPTRWGESLVPTINDITSSANASLTTEIIRRTMNMFETREANSDTSVIDSIIRAGAGVFEDEADNLMSDATIFGSSQATITVDGNQDVAINGRGIQQDLPLFVEPPNDELGKYFKLMMATFNVKASWSESLKSKSEINKYLQSVKEISPNEKVLEQDFLANFLSVSRGDATKEITNRIDYLNREIIIKTNNYHRSVDNLYTELNTKKTQLAALMLKAGQTENHWLQEEINKAAKGGFWSNFRSHHFSGHSHPVLLFDTPRRWAVSYDNEKHGMDYKVLFGMMTFSFSRSGSINLVNNSNSSVYRHIPVDDIYKPERYGHAHPHISTDGSICWGNANDMYRTLPQDRNFAKVLEALQTILMNFNPESPYRGLENFADLYGADRIIGNYTHYKRVGSVRIDTSWCEENNIVDYDDDVDELTDDCGDIVEVSTIDVFQQVNINTGEAVDNKRYLKVDDDGAEYYMEITPKIEGQMF